ncbi:hypothetical protein [Nocardioides sp. AE5]|uniref:hypothetical protein n=1 Tax=Nocardioides sp. AE5 TaxID=2962573 RepID=UPI002881C660|nr:hypothetical protein [Nocardioides sp. AE5]MDT0200417.1 hypothetical protein [Nocardioides sp. AE5]
MNPMRRTTIALAAVALVAGFSACGSEEAGEAVSGEAINSGSAAPELDPAIAALPQASPDLQIAPFTDSAVGNSTTPGEEGRFQFPGMTVTISSLTVLDSVHDWDGAGDEVRAADGERLVVVNLEHQALPGYAYTSPKAQVLVEDGGKRINVFDDAQSIQPFLVSASEDARLVLAVGGRDFTASLGSDDFGVVEDAGRVAPARQDLAQFLTFDTATTKDGTREGSATLQATVASVTRTNYLPAELNQGVGQWAEEGKAFLLVDMTGVDVTVDGFLDMTTDEILTWTASAGDETLPARGPVSLKGASSGTAVLDVPADLREFTLTVAARSSANAYMGPSIDLSHGERSIDVVLP